MIRSLLLSGLCYHEIWKYHKSTRQAHADLFQNLNSACSHSRGAVQGRPIYVQHLGMIDMKKMLEVTDEERIIKFHVQEYERCARYIMPACSRAAGRHIDQTFAIIDVKGTAECTAKVQHLGRSWGMCGKYRTT